MRILLVEDDAAIVSALSELLVAEGYGVCAVPRQDEAIAALESSPFDLALLDVTLVQGSGFAVAAAARKECPEMPVMFLTASDDEYSTIAGLDMGAVDYIAKPFRPQELLARIRGALLRGGGRTSKLSLGDIAIDTDAATVRKRGREVVLSALEYRLLLLFAQSGNSLVSRDRVRSALWDSGSEYLSDNAINVYLKRLRNKVEDDPANPCLILTVRGLGYRAGC